MDNQTPNTEAAQTPTTEPKQPIKAVMGAYKGKPIVTFQEGENDRFPFSFGATKARKLLSFIEANGVDAFVNALKFVSDNSK